MLFDDFSAGAAHPGAERVIVMQVYQRREPFIPRARCQASFGAAQDLGVHTNRAESQAKRFVSAFRPR